MPDNKSFPLIVRDVENEFKRLTKKGAPPPSPSEPRPYEPAPLAGAAEPYALPTIGSVHGAFGGHLRKDAAGITFGQPAFFSPVYTPINWQIPSKRREVYQWNVVDGELLTEDFRSVSFDDLEVVGGITIEDTITGGLMTEGFQSKAVMSGSAEMCRPPRMGVRTCQDKRCIRLKATGNWKRFAVSEEHGVYVIDGKSWRRIKKADKDNAYRRGLGKKSRAPRIARPSKFVSRVEAQNVALGDFLLTPVPKFGGESINQDLAYLVGLVAADGHLCIRKNSVRSALTMNVDEKEWADAAVSAAGVLFTSRPHTSCENAIRIETADRRVFEVCSKFISGKLKAKTFTKAAFSLNRESMLALLAGYFDGDGHFNPVSEGIVINGNSKPMMEQIFIMSLMCGMRATLNRHPQYNDNFNSGTEWVYRVQISASDVSVVSGLMKSGKVPAEHVCKKKRDLRFFHEEDGVRYLASPVEEKTEFLYTGTGWDMQIDPDRSYALSFFKVSNCRYFYENEPRVAAALDFYSKFPISTGFELECVDRHVRNYFEQWCENVDLERWMRLISHEVHLLGDCFPFLELECPQCKGRSSINGEVCEHDGGTFKRVVILNPDFVEVFTSPITPKHQIALLPDDELKDLVRQRGPGAEALTTEVRNMVMGGRPIPLEMMCVSHLKHGESGYRRYGISLIRRLFPILSYKTKLMTAQWIVAERMIIPVKVVKVGTEERPASEADISSVQAQLQMTSNDPNLVIVTHHAFSMEWVGAGSQVLQLSQEWEFINQEILDGLGLNKSILNSEGPVYASAQIGAEVMIKRLDTWRRELAAWVERKVFAPIAKMRGFVRDNEWGEKEFIYPRLKWKALNLRDVNQERQQIMTLYDKGLISRQRVLEQFDIDPDVEAERMRYEKIEAASEPAPPGGGPGAAAGGGGMGGLESALGGGGGGGGGGGLDLGGGLTPPGPEAGGAPGGAPPGGAAPPAGAPPALASTASGIETVNIGEFGGKVLSPKKRKQMETLREKVAPKGQNTDGDGFERDPKGRIWRTSLEIKLEKGMADRARAGKIAHRWFSGYEVKHGPHPYLMDFSFPDIKLDVEADGETFHALPKQQERDERRDTILRNLGWTVVRFSEKEVTDQLSKVLDRIETEISRKEDFLRARRKKNG